MLDDDGKEVPGTKGYKLVALSLIFVLSVFINSTLRYFGRAKELPGVKELFQSRAKEEEEESQAQAFYKKFAGQGPSYYGDLDERDGSLLKFEEEAEAEGMCMDFLLFYITNACFRLGTSLL